MKTIQHIESGNIIRLSDERATKRVSFGGWKYIPKSVWKKEVRDVSPNGKNEQKTVKSNKSSKSQKRQLRKKQPVK